MMTTGPRAEEPVRELEAPTLPFPVQDRDAASESPPEEAAREDACSAEDALAAVETMSRRIEDLARELNCLGFFDGDDDRPRAA